MNNGVLSFIGLMKRAGALSVSMDTCREALREGRTQVILLARDSSSAVKERFERSCLSYNVPCITLDYSKSELAYALGLNDCAVISINDSGFYKSLLKKLQ